MLRYFILLFLFLAFSCRQANTPKEADLFNKHKVADAQPVYLDSVLVQQFFNSYPEAVSQKPTVKEFYRNRGYRFAWMTKEGLNEQAGSFLNMLSNEKNMPVPDSVATYSRIYSLYNHIARQNKDITPADTNAVQLDILLTASFFDYAKRNWGGTLAEYTRQVGWYIDKKNLNYTELLDCVLSGAGCREPVYRQYGLLKQQLLKYDSIEKAGGWQPLAKELIKMKPGDSSHFIPQLRQQLLMLGDLAMNSNSNVYDTALMTGIKRFQHRHGLEEDGIIGPATGEELNTGVHDRIQQIVINMERCRWVPVQLEGDYLVVNIPSYRLYIYRGDTLEWYCNVVVGKTTTKTAIFNANLEYIVFNPYWNVPGDIFSNETLPEIQGKPDYLASHNMEVVDSKGNLVDASSIRWSKYSGSDFPYIVRQKPGPDNALGKVKFLFPNSFDIYLHDTPAKLLFDENQRTFSHGCIRVEEPMKLAKYLLRENKEWTEEAIDKALEGKKQVFVKVKNKIPVFITYFTAWVDREGKINFAKDIYKHDERMRSLLMN